MDGCDQAEEAERTGTQSQVPQSRHSLSSSVYILCHNNNIKATMEPPNKGLRVLSFVEMLTSLILEVLNVLKLLGPRAVSFVERLTIQHDYTRIPISRFNCMMTDLSNIYHAFVL